MTEDVDTLLTPPPPPWVGGGVPDSCASDVAPSRACPNPAALATADGLFRGPVPPWATPCSDRRFRRPQPPGGIARPRPARRAGDSGRRGREGPLSGAIRPPVTQNGRAAPDGMRRSSSTRRPARRTRVMRIWPMTPSGLGGVDADADPCGYGVHLHRALGARGDTR